MACRASDDLPRYVAGELSPRQRVQLEQHLAQCASCRAEIETLRRLDGLLQSLPAAPPPDDLTRLALRRAQSELARPDPGLLRPGRLVTSWGSGLAAAAAICLLVWYASVPQHQSPAPSGRIALADPAPTAATDPQMALLEPSAPSQARPASMPRPWTAAALATPRRETVRRREPGTAATVAVAAASPALPRRAADGADGDLGRATMYASAGDVELHRVALENVALAHPDSPQAATALLAAADLHATQGEVREADAAYRQVTALRHAPAMSQALAYKALGDLRRETVGDDELAAHHYRMAAQVLRSAASSGAANDQLRMLTALGQVQETLGEVDNAASAYTRAATLSAGPKVATGTGARLSQTL